MEITIIGAGEVGQSIATALEESHEITVVDDDEKVVEDLLYSHDILTIHGDGRDLKTLREANVESADLVVACTDNDEVNITICGSVKSISDTFTIARVRQQTLFETWKQNTGVFGVDFMACANLLTARAVFRISGLSSAQDVDTFIDGLVRMAEFEIESGSPIADKTVRDIDQYNSLTFAGIFRGNKMLILNGETVLRPGDRLVVIGSPTSVTTFANHITTCPRDLNDEIVIIGGSAIGYQTAQQFEPHSYKLRLIESHPDRAREVAETLPDTTVLNGDPAELKFLEREHIGEANLVISALNDDDQNLLVSLVARQLGADETIAIVENSEYTDLFEMTGIDVTVNPREEIAEEIIRFTHLIPTEKIVMLEHDRAEVIEIEVTQSSVLTGRQISDSISRLPDGIVIGAIARDGELVTPRGKTVIESGDRIVLFAYTKNIEKITELV